MRWYFNTAGSNYRGFFIHDDRTQPASLRVYFSVQDHVDVACDLPIPQIKQSGGHETGNCGFAFDNALMSRIRDKTNFVVFETGSGIMLYRRLGSSGFIPTKLFCLTPRFAPLHPLLETIRRRSQLSYTGIDRHTRETVISILNINYADSIFAAGAVDWIRFERFATRATFTSVLFMLEPERLLALTVAGLVRAAHAGTLPPAHVEPELTDLANELMALNFEDPETLETWGDRLSPEATQTLANPMVRHVAAVPQATPVGPRNLSAALSVLSRLDIVGTEATEPLFLDMVKAASGIDPRYEVMEVAADAGSDDPLVGQLMLTRAARELTQFDRMFYEICNLGLTAEKPDIGDVAGILQQA